MSVVPGAIDALVARLAARPGLAGVQIFDGPEAKFPEQDFIAVGLSPEDLETPATRQPAGPATTSESAEITCAIRSWDGTTDIRSRRLRAYQLLDEIRSEIDGDNTLGGAVDQAELTGSTYMPAQGKRGVVVDVVLTVQVTRF